MSVSKGKDPTPVVPVILCGGAGARLWPVSRPDRPKPFHGLGRAQTLLQQTALRLQHPARAGAMIVVANEEHRFMAAQQLGEVGVPLRHLILEPEGRGTAPALCLAALALAQAGQGHAVMLMTPADHWIGDEAALWAALNQGLPAAAAGAIVLFGVAPDRAEPGYGHIRVAPRLADGLHPVLGFVEKPPLAEAQRLSRTADHLWNSGLYLLRADTWLAALERYRPDLVQACRAAMRDARGDGDFLRPAKEAFLHAPAQSVEHAVTEPLSRDASGAIALRMGELACGWSDIGAWDAVQRHADRDAAGNAVQGPHVLLGCSNTLVLSSGRLVAAIGLQDMVVVETADAVLVAHRSATQQVQSAVQHLKTHGPEQALSSQTGVQRPWGWFDVIGRGPNWLVKRIVVRAGASLSLQRHRHRSEHWTVLRGVASVWCEGRQFQLQPHASTFVGQGQVHRLANPGPDELELLELQTGERISEDDIERLEDDYGRAPV